MRAVLGLLVSLGFVLTSGCTDITWSKGVYHEMTDGSADGGHDERVPIAPVRLIECDVTHEESGSRVVAHFAMSNGTHQDFRPGQKSDTLDPVETTTDSWTTPRLRATCVILERRSFARGDEGWVIAIGAPVRLSPGEHPDPETRLTAAQAESLPFVAFEGNKLLLFERDRRHVLPEGAFDLGEPRTFELAPAVETHHVTETHTAKRVGCAIALPFVFLGDVVWDTVGTAVVIVTLPVTLPLVAAGVISLSSL